MIAKDVQFTGAVYTPAEVADALISNALEGYQGLDISILEPSVGDGQFLRLMDQQLLGNASLCAVDIDDMVVEHLKNERGAEDTKNIRFVVDEFVKFSLETSEKFDLIIGNPPFIRRHNFSNQFKSSLAELADITNYPMHQLKNSWAAFVVCAEQMLSEKGCMAFVLPYEILSVLYGHYLLQTVIQNFLRVDFYISNEKAFKEIDQDAVCIIARKEVSASNKGYFLNHVKTLSDLTPYSSCEIRISDNIDLPLELKSSLIPRETIQVLDQIRVKTVNIGELCRTYPGLVTAANDFFIKSARDLNMLGLDKWGKPVLKKGGFMPKGISFTSNDYTKLVDKGEPAFFLHFKGDERAQFDENVHRYLSEGRAAGIDQRYKCRNRKYWYEVPYVPPSQGMFFKRSHKYPRVCINESDVLLTDTAYNIECKEGVTMKGLCFSFYNSFTLLFAEVYGRFYGGGVLELTPNEFRHLPIYYYEPDKVEFEEFAEVHKKASNAMELAKIGDQMLQAKLSISDKEMAAVQNALVNLRQHRLRHG